MGHLGRALLLCPQWARPVHPGQQRIQKETLKRWYDLWKKYQWKVFQTWNSSKMLPFLIIRINVTFGSTHEAQSRTAEKVGQWSWDKCGNLNFQEIKIAEVIIHPDYWSDKTKHGNPYDLALIQMDKVKAVSSILGSFHRMFTPAALLSRTVWPSYTQSVSLPLDRWTGEWPGLEQHCQPHERK